MCHLLLHARDSRNDGLLVNHQNAAAVDRHAVKFGVNGHVRRNHTSLGVLSAGDAGLSEWVCRCNGSQAQNSNERFHSGTDFFVPLPELMKKLTDTKLFHSNPFYTEFPPEIWINFNEKFNFSVFCECLGVITKKFKFMFWRKMFSNF